MSDRRLQVFHTVARLLSFTKAAESLSMTQPAVTFQIRQLEEDFNTRLFDRGHNKIGLTETGKRVYEYSERIFVLYSEMQEVVKEMTGDVTGALVLGASTTIAEYMLPALLGSFKQKYPEINIRLKVGNTENVVSMMEENLIDLGIVEGSINNKLLLSETCRMDQLLVIMHPHHELANEMSLDVHCLLAYPFIFREVGSGTREVISKYLRSQDINEDELDNCLELGSPEAIKGAVEAGLGLSIASCATVIKELKLGTLKAVRLDPPLERPFSFVRQRQKFRVRILDELLDFSRQYCKKNQQGSGSVSITPPQ
ncbi:MAG: LysR family transcriptional regulator [Gammaproteobacteria bacterium]|nr:LysR family transcriptional regulator [Gammaproteobacteria bacterium]